MPKASILQFNNYTVTEMSFKSTPVPGGQHEFELHPQFHHSVVDCGENQYDVHLSVEIVSAEDKPIPFQLKAALVGRFALCDGDGTISPEMKESIIQKNTISILFPFLRSIVATLTSSANIPTLLLPVMNFSEKTLSP